MGTLTRRRLLASAAAAAVAAPFVNVGRYQVFAASKATYSARAVSLVNTSLVIDMLSLLDMRRVLEAEEAEDTGADPFRYSREELLAIKASGIDVFHPAIGIDGASAQLDVMNHLAGYNGLIAEYPDLLARVDSVADLDALADSGKIGIVLGVQDSEHFQAVDDVKRFYAAGQRVSQLTYNAQNRIASGSTDRADGGVSDFGASVIQAMNEIGMVVDVSHCGDRTTLDAFELSVKPVLITHSNCRALVPGHPRCKTDDAIKAMAAKGGVMGITGVRNFVRNEEPTTIDVLPHEVYEKLKGHYKTSYSFRDKIDIEGLDHPKKIYDVTEALLRRGYGNEDIRAVLGGNFRRVLGQIWTS